MIRVETIKASREILLKTLHHFFMPVALQSSVWPKALSVLIIFGWLWGQKLPRTETKFLS